MHSKAFFVGVVNMWVWAVESNYDDSCEHVNQNRKKTLCPVMTTNDILAKMTFLL